MCLCESESEGCARACVGDCRSACVGVCACARVCVRTCVYCLVCKLIQGSRRSSSFSSTHFRFGDVCVSAYVWCVCMCE